MHLYAPFFMVFIFGFFSNPLYLLHIIRQTNAKEVLKNDQGNK